MPGAGWLLMQIGAGESLNAADEWDPLFLPLRDDSGRAIGQGGLFKIRVALLRGNGTTRKFMIDKEKNNEVNQFDNWVRSLVRYVIGRVEAPTRDMLPFSKDLVEPAS